MTREDALAREREILDRQPGVAEVTIEEFARRFSCGIIEWWAALQHQGVDTRLLDWTRNPYHALFFAVRESRHWNEAGAIWLFHPKSLQRAMLGRFGFYRFPGRPAEILSDPNPQDQLFAGWPIREVERCWRQHGEFTWSARIDAVHEELIDGVLPQDVPGSGITHEKWIVPAEAKPALLAQLEAMGVTQAALLPGDDGDLAAQRELERALTRYQS